MPTPGETASPRSTIEGLADRLGATWPHLATARALSGTTRGKLEAALAGHDGDDTVIVVFGSLARDEFTEGSDIDWTLLVDGSADPHHQEVAHEIARHVQEAERRAPGREGTFGSLSFSHDLIHLIGGEDDSNRNTTRRILLLLESMPLGNADAYERTVSNVLRRYLEEDRGLWYGSGRHKVPRFLLNDIVRYWRTMTVDFAYKQRSRGGKGFAIRNLKLRMSRKLIFIAGLLTCFSLETELTDEEREELLDAKLPVEQRVPRLVEHLKRRRAPPLEVLARAVLERPILHEPARSLFGAYDQFLGILADREMRKHLESLTYGDLAHDDLFLRGRTISHEFQEALHRIFLTSESPFYTLTLKYGVF